MLRIKRIGPGSLVNIWHDNWIPGIKGFKPRVRLPGVAANTVDELMEWGERSWNEQPIQHQSFIGIHAEEILKIQPSQTMDADLLAWTPERGGGYSVRSAYRILKEEQSKCLQEKEGDTATSEAGRWWKVLKKLKVPPKPMVRWRPPEEGWVKVNSDGAFDSCGGRGAGAAVLRDHLGQVVGAQARWLGPVQEALAAEAAAVYEGLRLASQMGVTKVILESDNSVLVNALNSTSLDRSVISGLCYDVKDILRSFSSFKVCYIHREANSLADKCVKEVSMENPSMIWLNCIPQWLQEAAANDCNLEFE